MTSGQPGLDLLADHSVLLAIPAFLPALAVVAFIVTIAVRDRRAEEREKAAAGTDTADSETASPDPPEENR
ncbi:hypothetical protein [Nocardia farcinica]|uniref:hypothetical protein n=1 Tax=Nocardia farcinica TaxID=37329 RepID=UPI002455FF5C|nr:hypothetical protein [Nocardia farcinica]